jgi:hypothetical protein
MTDFFIASFYGESSMTYEEIEKLAGHRQVPAWVVKLVGDAIAVERERIAKQFDSGVVNVRARDKNEAT